MTTRPSRHWGRCRCSPIWTRRWWRPWPMPPSPGSRMPGTTCCSSAAPKTGRGTRSSSPRPTWSWSSPAQELFGEARAEDCWLPYFSVSCSLTDARVVTHRTGPLWQCVRASSALPGLGPPVIQSGSFLVDGAILNNLPADILEDEGMGPVIAVNVSPKEDLGTVREDNYRLSGWRILWERLLGRPGAREYPSALWVLQRTVLLASVDMAERMKKLASLYLHVRVDDYEMFKWDEIDRIVPVGYASGKDALARWAGTQASVLAAPESHRRA
jgi:predicted acylesterase/phospholipase RssA